MQVDLEAVRKTKLTLQGTTLKWMDVVVLARDKLTQASLITPPSSTPAAPRPPRAPVAEVAQNNPGGSNGKVCTYCAPLGSGMEGHDEKNCFINPNSTQYRPDVRTRRI